MHSALVNIWEYYITVVPVITLKTVAPFLGPRLSTPLFCNFTIPLITNY